MSYGEPWSLPEKQGLYDPTLEKDACGVGFIVAIDGKRSHKVYMSSIILSYIILLSYFAKRDGKAFFFPIRQIFTLVKVQTRAQK